MKQPKIQKVTTPEKVETTKVPDEPLTKIEMAKLLLGVVKEIDENGAIIKIKDKISNNLIPQEVYDILIVWVLDTDTPNHERSWEWFRENKCMVEDGKYVIK